MSSPIVFSRPYRSADELTYIAAALESGHVHGDGQFTATASRAVERVTGASRALLTTSGTHALDMCSLLLGIGPGDEVILPSFTFSSAATSITITGATPVFVDIEPVTLNIEPAKIEAAITPRTRAISVVHYGGVAADLTSILDIAHRHGLAVIEDNAHGLGATFEGKGLGTFGDLGIQSFHDTKNVHSGEGGALLVNRQDLLERAEIMREKGTNRARFLRGQVDKYTWTDIGSSYLMSELSAAVLASQLESFETIQRLRHDIWNSYNAGLAEWAERVGATLMQVPAGREHPAHVFYALMPTHEDQSGLLDHLRANDIVGTFHYIPLDSSPGGLRYGRTPEPCVVAHDLSARLVRLPLWAGLEARDVERVVDAVEAYVPVAAPVA